MCPGDCWGQQGEQGRSVMGIGSATRKRGEAEILRTTDLLRGRRLPSIAGMMSRSSLRSSYVILHFPSRRIQDNSIYLWWVWSFPVESFVFDSHSETYQCYRQNTKLRDLGENTQSIKGRQEEQLELLVPAFIKEIREHLHTREMNPNQQTVGLLYNWNPSMNHHGMLKKGNRRKRKWSL